MFTSLFRDFGHYGRDFLMSLIIIGADDIVRRHRYSDHFVTVCGYVGCDVCGCMLAR